MNGRKRRVAAVLVLIMLVMGLGTSVVQADMSAKPSIELLIVNGPQEYYLALLEEGERTGGNSELKLDAVNPESVKEYLRGFYYDGWCFWSSPGEDTFYHSTEKYDNYKNANIREGAYLFEYMVPNPFRVIVIGADGTVSLSDELSFVEFDAVCTYDVAAGTLTEQREGAVARRIADVTMCFLITIIVEFVFLLGFHFPLTKRNVLCFILINAATNIPFNILLVHSRSWDYFAYAIIGEVVIILVEAFLYTIALRDDDGKKNPKGAVLLSIIGNLVSALGTLFVMNVTESLARGLAGLIEKIIG